MAQKEDRRVKRTKKLLRDALVELILEKGYGAITVQDILDQADVGRSTFYAHFGSKDDLLVGDAPYFHIMFEEDQSAEGVIDPIPSFLAMFEHVAEQRQLFRALVGGEGVNLVQQAVQTHLCTTFVAHFDLLAQHDQSLSLPSPVVAHYLTGGLMSLLIWWLDEEMPYSPDEINVMFMQMARGTAVSNTTFKQ